MRTLSEAFRDWLKEKGRSKRKLARETHTDAHLVIAWSKGRAFPKERYLDRLADAGIATHDELAGMRRGRRASILLTCPHCGCLIRRRTGKSLDDKFLHPPSVRMPVAQHIRQVS